MYLSPAVRTMRDDPTPGVEATLLVRLDGADDGGGEADPSAVREAVADAAGDVVAETQFGTLHVAVAEPAVADLLDALPPDVAAVETVTPGLAGDAGEDLDPDG